jgi:hypothetical protein
MNTFELHLDLGNDAMQEGRDVASALERVADLIRGYVETGERFGIRDDNGNTVGHYGFDLEPHIETRLATDAENAFKVASYNAAKAVVDGQPVRAREWLEVAKAATAVDGVLGVRRLELEDGDTIVLETDQLITNDQLREIRHTVEAEVGENVRVLIFGGGVAVAGVWQGAR